MKNNLQKFLGVSLLSVGVSLNAQITNTAVTTGPSTTVSPYIIPAASNVTVTSLLTVPESISGYTFCGLPDGAGAFDNGNGSFTFLLNHEMQSTAGAVRAHGSTGAFVSKWVINKATKAVVSGSDLIQNVNIWNGLGYTTYNSTNSSTMAAFGRFCSGDLPSVKAFYNPATGLGTTERIFMNGEETGSEGRMFAHVVTGVNAGSSYQLPLLGRFSCENQCARPYASNKTVVIGMDDSSPGQVYMYVGTKTNTGSDVDKAGLTNGNLYGISVNGILAESNGTFPSASTSFSCVNFGDVSAITGASLNTISTNSAVTTFLRPEDGAWDPRNPSVFYFVTTNGFGSPSRLYKLSFTNINNPENGGTIVAVLDGTESQQMLDNFGFDNYGNMILQEDVGNNVHLGKQWNYNVDTDVLTQITTHDPNRFLSTGTQTLTQDEEASGAIDMQEILGAGWWMIVDQAHYSIPSPIVEGGQIVLLYNPFTANSNPEISISGNSNNISNNANTTLITNNTNYGNVQTNQSITKPFVVTNAGPGALTITGFSVTGTNASEFTLITPPSTPYTLAANASTTLNLQFVPTAVGNRSATVNINNNDFDESGFNFKVEGTGTLSTVGIKNNTNNENIILIYPNPADESAILKIQSIENSSATIQTIDVTGKVINTAKVNLVSGDNEIKIETASLKSGNYFVNIKSHTIQKSLKLNVVH